MSEAETMVFGVAERYATALFELASDNGELEAVEADIARFETLRRESADLRRLMKSLVFSTEDQLRAIGAVVEAAGLGQTVSNFIKLVASKRRLFVLPQLVADLRARIAAEKGEVTAEVTAAAALSKEQTEKLAATLKARVGKDVKVKLAVDESLIGGLVVKLGSTMIDTSIKSKLAALQNAMKEVG